MSFISCVAEHVINECFNGHMNLPKFDPCMAAITCRAECIPHELVGWAGVA